MKIKYSALVSDMSGKLNGSVATKNRYGSYIRNKVTPINRKSVAQVVIRAIFTSVAQAWRGLTASQRSQWNAGATNFTRTNIFGDIRNLSGFNLYMRLNQNLRNIGAAVITACPLPKAVSSLVLTDVVVDASTPSVTITFPGAIDAGSTVEIFATPGLSAGKNFVSSEFRKIGNFLAADVSPLVLTSDYQAVFGGVPAAGTKVFVKAKTIDTATGIPGSESMVECLVQA